MRCLRNLSTDLVRLSWSLADNSSSDGLSVDGSSSVKKSSTSSVGLYDGTAVGFAQGLASSRIAWAFDPPKPKEFTLALASATFGHGTNVWRARSLRRSKSTCLHQFPASWCDLGIGLTQRVRSEKRRVAWYCPFLKGKHSCQVLLSISVAPIVDIIGYSLLIIEDTPAEHSECPMLLLSWTGGGQRRSEHLRVSMRPLSGCKDVEGRHDAYRAYKKRLSAARLTENGRGGLNLDGITSLQAVSR